MKFLRHFPLYGKIRIMSKGTLFDKKGMIGKTFYAGYFHVCKRTGDDYCLKQTKKVLSLLLVLCMICSTLPVHALATDAGVSNEDLLANTTRDSSSLTKDDVAGTVEPTEKTAHSENLSLDEETDVPYSEDSLPQKDVPAADEEMLANTTDDTGAPTKYDATDTVEPTEKTVHSENLSLDEETYAPDSEDILPQEDVPAAQSDTVPYAVTGGNIYFDPTTGTITDYDDTVTAVDIPASINGVAVTKIGDYAFEYCSSLTNIIIPNSVTSIGAYAFKNCSSLTSITIPNSVTSIAGWTFAGCSNLTSIAIPNSVTSIAGWAFEDCNSLTSISIPNGVTHIGKYTFHNCSSLTSISIPNSVTYIQSWAFYGCSSLRDVYYSKGEQEWRKIYILSDGKGDGNASLKNATIHYNSTGPEDSTKPDDSTKPEDSTKKVNIDVLKDYDAATGKVEFANTSLSGWYTTDETDMSFADNLDELLGTLVIARWKDDSPSLGSYITSIEPLDVKIGIVEKADSSGVVIDGQTYPISSEYPPSFLDGILTPSYTDSLCLCGLHEGKVAVLTKTESKSGILSEGSGKYVTIDGKQYSSAYLDETHPFLSNPDAWLKHDVSYKLANNVVCEMELKVNGVSGTCGDNLTWTLENGVLTISGEGEMYNYGYNDEGEGLGDAPWSEYKERISYIVVENGVTSIGRCAFELLNTSFDSEVKSIKIGEDVTSIGEKAFAQGAKKVIFSGNAPKIICCNSFGSSVGIDVYYPADKDHENWKKVIAINYDNNSIAWISSEDATGKLAVEDMLSFPNEAEYFGNTLKDDSYGYYITQSDYDHLVSHLENKDKKAVTKNGLFQSTFNIEGKTWNHMSWGGSCAGMASVIALVKNDAFPISSLDSSPASVSKIASGTTETQSLINYYQWQQCIPALKKAEDEFMEKPHDEQIRQLDTMVTKAERDGTVVMINFGYTTKDSKGKLKDGHHTILGFAVEHGIFNFTIGGKSYHFNRRVLTYDPAQSGAKQDYHSNAIYYNNNYREWAMIGLYNSVSTDKGMNINSDDNTGQLESVISSSNYINAVDYFTGQINYNSTPGNAILYPGESNFIIAANNSQDTVLNGLFDGTKTISDNGALIIGDSMDTDESDVSFSVSLPDHNDDYTVTSNDGTDFAMSCGNYFLDAYSDQAGSVTFARNGKVTLKTENADTGYVSVTADDGYTSLPWYTIDASSENTKSLSVELTDEGVLVSGDDLNDTTIVGTNDEETKELAFSTDHDTVLVTEKSDELVILADEDADGTFETPITTKPSTYTITFDPNGGYGSMKDGVATKGNPYTLPACNFTAPNSNLKFDAWAIGNTSGTKVAANATYTFTDDTTVYALWTNKNIDTEDSKPSTDGGSSSGGSSGGSSSGGGGGSYSSSSSVSVSKTENGSVSLSPSKPKKSETVTITVTPDDGYELSALTVKDSSGKEISTTKKDDGKYTFTMPSGKVTITPAFTKAKDKSDDESTQQPSINFTDVPSGVYYTDAVAWAIAQGITNGTTETTFSPDNSCTRAQMVTFLWRSAGSPSPTNSDNPFTDVAAGTYYYDAVLWAVEHGITTGTTDTTFSPNNTVTRGQTVTFMYRNAGSPKVDTVSPFVDVPSDAYYADAVVWAASNDITKGTTDTTFSPNESCTRAQIVTFLYRKDINANI